MSEPSARKKPTPIEIVRKFEGDLKNMSLNELYKLERKLDEVIVRLDADGTSTYVTMPLVSIRGMIDWEIKKRKITGE